MQFRRLVALALVVACVSGADAGLRSPALAAASRTVPGEPQLPAAPALTISGTVFRSNGTTPADGVRLRLRSLDTGAIVGTTTSDKQGGFSFAVSAPGRYVVEAAGRSGGVAAVSDPVTLAGAAVSTQVILPADEPPPTAEILMAIASGVGLVGWVVGNDGTTSPER